MTYDLWTEASRDVDAENRLRAMEMAKHASQGVWAFLAQAQDPLEYNDRMELARDRIESVAASTGVSLDDLLGVFEQRFALLMEAKDNPFGDDDSDSDDEDEDGDGNTDDDGKDADSGDETDSGGDTDDSDDSDMNNPDDPNPDDDDESQEKDPDQDGDDDSSAEGDTDHDFFPKGSSARYSSLLARIEAGENPLNWGGRPFVRSSARKTAAGANDETVSDSNTPQPEQAADGLGGPDMAPSLPETTKPRQLPEGGGMDATGPQEIDPALNGGDIGAGADTPPDTQREAKLRAIAAEVREHNPHLSNQQVARVAFRVMAKYLTKQAEDLSPLLYGDRGDVHDGPLTHTVKTVEPPDPKKLMPRPGGGGAAGEEAAGAAEGGEAVEALAPLLAL